MTAQIQVVGPLTKFLLAQGNRQEVEVSPNQASIFRPRYNTSFSPYSILKELIRRTTIQLGRGSKHSQQKQRTVFNIWRQVRNQMFNLSGHVNESKGNSIKITLFQTGNSPVSFEGVPLVLIKKGNKYKVEEKLQASGKPREFKVSFTNLEHGSYTLKVGDPNFNVFGFPRSCVDM